MNLRLLQFQAKIELFKRLKKINILISSNHGKMLSLYLKEMEKVLPLPVNSTPFINIKRRIVITRTGLQTLTILERRSYLSHKVRRLGILHLETKL